MKRGMFPSLSTFQHFAQASGSWSEWFVIEAMPVIVIAFVAYYPAAVITGLVHRLLEKTIPTPADPSSHPVIKDEIEPDWSWWLLCSMWGVFASIFYHYWGIGIW